MVAAALSSPASPHAQTALATPACTAPAEFTRLGHTLTHMVRRLASGEPITIVASASSPTAGAGTSSPAATYPSRLEADLKTRFPGRTIKVLNRGVGGEDASEMLARMDRDGRAGTAGSGALAGRHQRGAEQSCARRRGAADPRGNPPYEGARGRYRVD